MPRTFLGTQKTYEEAVKQGEDAIESWVMDAIADNEPLPAPRSYADTAA
jgi:predicted RNase H-like HicB family nuclease